MIIWGTVPTMRSVLTSITRRCGHPSRLLCFEIFIYTPSTVFVYTLYEIFWAPTCVSLSTFVDIIAYCFYDGSLTACEAVF